ncbi:MAG TPA: hypothetical protein DDY14_07260 [Chromatiaceae bacterium]|jgi:polar amino acid transport system substrate-binding protein|nr:hypothetical protein [Chromatiaceae bacterium]HCS89463.1 hypothetical protein [Chromatiaceae bacterium]
MYGIGSLLLNDNGRRARRDAYYGYTAHLWNRREPYWFNSVNAVPVTAITAGMLDRPVPQPRRLIMLLAFRLILVTATLIPQILAAQQIPCDSYYIVQRGDTLSKIAAAAYGRATAYQTIFSFNPGVLSNPDQLPVGVRLYIPCLGSDRQPPKIALEPLQKAGSEKQPTVKILTGAEYEPYVDSKLPEGGFSVELVKRAFEASDNPPAYRIDAISDWGAQLQPLISEGCYQLGFPWYKPDCTQQAKLGKSSLWRCENLHFSEAMHEVVISFYTRPELLDVVKTVDNLRGKRICRPRGYFTHDLEAKGLTPTTMTRVEAESPEDCFEMLVNGDVDVVTVNAETADRVQTKLRISSRVADMIQFATIETLHVVGMKTDPNTRANLLRIDQGLSKLKENGQYRQIAAKHLKGP